MNTVAVVDYGMGNLHSIAKALERAGDGARVRVTGDAREIERAERVVFPGVGAIRDCMRELAARGLDDALRRVAESRPMLGICLGMQALLDFSEENGGTPTLGVIDGTVRHFGAGLADADGQVLKIPHMGWNGVEPVHPHPLWEGIAPGARFYFVHSYYADPAAHAVVAGQTRYGFAFAAALAQANVFAVQFHPEKSQRSGLALLANFVRWDGSC